MIVEEGAGPVSGTAISWPARYRPGVAPVHVSNQMEIAASPGRVWQELVAAAAWPSWYPNSSHVDIQGGETQLQAHSRFSWKTFGVSLRSEVMEFIPPERIAWVARGLGVEAYHAWLLTPFQGGCHVLTEESQYGFLARLAHALSPHRMERGHDLWLRALKARVERSS